MKDDSRHREPRRGVAISVPRLLRFLGSLAITSLLLLQLALSPKDLEFPIKIVLKNEYHSIDSVTRSKEAGFLKFGVSSAHAVYEVEGVARLVKLLHEIEVIERIRRNKESSGFFDGVASSVENTKDGFVNLVTHPVKSVAGLGGAAKKIGRGIGGMFREKEQGEKTSFSETLMGSSERELAKQFGVDVYTTNPYLKELLRKMAKSRAGGKGAFAVVSFLIPVGLVASVALTASGVNGTADQIVNDNGREDLFYLNKKALVELGFAEPDVLRVLNLSYYSPREVTYLRVYLESLQKVEGWREIFRAARKASSEWQALKILYAAQLAADAQEKNRFKKMRVFEDGIGLFAAGRIVFIAPYDDLNSGLGAKIKKRIEALKREWGLETAEVWNAGKVKVHFGAVKVKEWALVYGIKE